jgi:hypothetical protein
MEEEVLHLLPLVWGGALEEDLLLLLLLLLGEGLLQQLVVGALKEDCIQLDWEVLKLHGELLLLSTGALLPVMMLFCFPFSFPGMGLSCVFCPVCPVSSVVFGVPCSETDKLLKNEFGRQPKSFIGRLLVMSLQTPHLSNLQMCMLWARISGSYCSLTKIFKQQH